MSSRALAAEASHLLQAPPADPSSSPSCIQHISRQHTMSGVEIAAIVLKTFPILLQAANAFLPIFQGTNDWFTFEQTYRIFISDIRAELIFYKQSLRIFLKPFEFDLEENGLMNQNADAPFWYDITTQDRIRLRIGDDFDWFLDQLRTMNTTLKALFELLPKRNEKVRKVFTSHAST
jgi:hypothetical protein